MTVSPPMSTKKGEVYRELDILNIEKSHLRDVVNELKERFNDVLGKEILVDESVATEEISRTTELSKRLREISSSIIDIRGDIRSIINRCEL